MKTGDSAARVRELCRRLEPIIGSQAQRIWKAFMLENDAGKEQILEYLEILCAQHFHARVGEEVAQLIPPGREEVDGSYCLGNVTYNNQELYPFGLREGEWIHHVGIFGRTGAGKTNLGLLMVKRLLEHKKPVLILDWKRNYRDLTPLPGFEDMAVYTIGRHIVPFRFNPLVPPPQTNPQTWLKKLVALVAQAYLLGDGVIYLLHEALDRVYQKSGVYSGQVERWPTFRDVLQVLKERNTSGREAGWMSSALRALSSLCFGEMDVLLNQGHDDLRQLLARPVVLELDALTQSDKVFFAQVILLWIHHFRMAESSREQFKHAILIEEAHHVLSGERQSLVGGQSVMDLTFREIREFGEGLIILDQHPSQISLPAMGNTYSTFCFNVKHRTDVNAMSQAMLLKDEEKDLLGQIPVGHAVVRLQGRGSGAFSIKVPEFPIRKGLVSDTDVIYRMTRLGLMSARDLPAGRRGLPTRVYPTEEPEGVDTSNAGYAGKTSEGEALALGAPTGADRISAGEKVFLQDVVRYPGSGIAERYKRLGLSVRQGQRFKEFLVQQGLLQEEVESTRTGRLRVLRLTEKGQLFSGSSRGLAA